MAELTDLDGVAEARAESMEEKGYGSVEKVAEADPAELADSLNRVSEDRATNFVLEAQNLVADDETVDVDDSDVLGPLDDQSSSESSESDDNGIVTSDDVSPSETNDEESDDTDGSADDESVEEDDETDSDERYESTSDDNSGDRRSNDSSTRSEESRERNVSDVPSDNDFPNREDVETYEFVVEQFDKRVETEVVTALTEARRHYGNRQPDRSRICDRLLELYRDTGLSFELTEDELNVFHAAVKNRENTYKGQSQLEYMRIMKRIREDLKEIRQQV